MLFFKPFIHPLDGNALFARGSGSSPTQFANVIRFLRAQLEPARVVQADWARSLQLLKFILTVKHA